MKARSLLIRVIVSGAWFIAAPAVVAPPSRAEASPSWRCPGNPEICQETCSLDPYGIPIFCEGGLCVCAAGYDTDPGPPIVCQPLQPGVMEFGAHGDTADVDCPGGCTSTPWGSAQGPWKDFDIVAVHGTAPGGEPFMPVWGAQANLCGPHGSPNGSWAGCVADAYPFATGIQGGGTDRLEHFDTCDIDFGCGDHACVSEFTSAWPFLDSTTTCELFAEGYGRPARIDFPGNVIVYRAPLEWENHSIDNPIIPGGDGDYTWNLHSPGKELYNLGKCSSLDKTCSVDSDCPLGQTCGQRVHIEFDATESSDRFTSEEVHENPFGTASLWWTLLRKEIDNNDNDAVQCWLRQFASPGLDCHDSRAHDPMSVVVGVTSLDLGDHGQADNDVEIHPVYAMAIRIQEGPDQPEKWAFFYRRQGNNGFCGNTNYSRCPTSYKLPLGMPFVPPGKILTGATVDVGSDAWHAWDAHDDPPSDVSVVGSFNLLRGTVVDIELPGGNEGVVGLVTVTPTFDTAPPTISCPPNLTRTADLGKCTASPMFAPIIGDNCSVGATCVPASGSAFPIGTTTDTCTATDQAGLWASCSFSVTTTAGNKCPQAAGYWKTHPGWPVTSLMLGTRLYTQADLMSILKSSTNGDASVTLASAEIAALLSQASGSSPEAMCNTVSDADAALGALLVPAQISPKTALGQRMISDANMLDSYDNGKLTPGCTP